ncbi:HATPase_c domain protein, putative [Talaromyces stipitatus ATCC 10500]|uniref:HATPase_c domain protein, putative n=1 Tax=Talaromyces stipitatus (strain ATCC 10500 / CBS 375.48 / QM 6759 / NRRL 1006) TaxID=441959 RepID=B8M6E9_TALSN|nr:HATPase_c domain protein, putative [Talaromyces stipitatus ATCC 10500]EED19324.1 HATPase_c domain protein, putative [Talaromyces stipitatus ATCC 10500]
MTQSIDFNALKARTMGSSNDEEAVTVDTRGLISKVLSRYSGKWTVLREMIQNAADASATRVTVKFETLPSTAVPLPNPADPTATLKHVITHHTLRRLMISNNGHAFTEKDWSRLKRIADGNPDETKIGAFGVGFYSVFDDCEEPFVSSGNSAMAFYWKGNSLFTRRLELSGSDASPDTTFVLDYRNDTSPVPSLLELAKFLATSLTFVGLESIDLWVDNWNLLRLNKKVAPSEKVTIPRDIETKTAEGLMKVTSVIREVAQVDATWMKIVEWSPQNTLSARLEGIRDTTTTLRSFFSKFTGSSTASDKPPTESAERLGDAEDLTENQKAAVFLHINTASVQPSISNSLSGELERATRKPPPKRTTIAILTPSHSTDDSYKNSKILSAVLPSKSGRIFIGFPTHQTTGLNAHISAPSVIPTVERESIDLNTRYISRWNMEMLRAAGIVCRIAWTADMSSIKTRIAFKSGPKVRKNDIMSFIPEAIHTANQFSFRESTPSATLGQTIEDSFWMCNKNASIEVLSTCGVLPSHHVRIAPKDLSFMESIPSLPDELVENAKEFTKKLIDVGLVTEVTVSDIKRELENNALTSAQLVEFISWIGRRAASGELDQKTTISLLSAAVANEEPSKGQPGQLLTLAGIDCYLNPARIPSDLPIPPSVIPFKYTKSLEKRQLDAIGWKELQTVPWLRWLVENAGNRGVLPVEKDITRTASFAAQILPVLSKQWDTLSQSSKQTVVDMLQPQTVIPVRNGMRRPEEAYFPTVRLFDDLPVVYGLSNVKDKFLAALGVRKTVELGVIFERLLNDPDPMSSEKSKPKWSHVDLIKYLTSVRDDIPAKDIERLKSTKICLAENSSDRQRYKISELFEPKESHQKLGLRIIDWPGKFLPHSKEAQFLSTLGLRSHPSAIEVIEIIAKAALAGDTALQSKAMSYFITEHHANKYFQLDMQRVTIAFLPIEGNKKLSAPKDCFTHEGAALLGFDILRRDLHPHSRIFGVSLHPPVMECVQSILKAPPKTPSEAKGIFTYMASLVPDLKEADIRRLGDAFIIPIPNRSTLEKRPSMRYVSPKNCYLGESEDYKDIFDFVDFGPLGNLFLQAVGSKQEPTMIEVAQMLVKEPARISSKFQSPEKYLSLLGRLADNLMRLKHHKDKDLYHEMMKAPFLLASKELPAAGSNTIARKATTDEADDIFEDDEQGIREWRLVAAKDAVIVDDYQSYTLFREHILAAPQEEKLEKFYAALGTPALSTLVEERAHWGAKSSDQTSAVKLQKIINERTRLFLHEHSSESIKHDTKWLEKHLSIVVVHSISLRRSLKNTGATHSQKRHAIITSQGSDRALWISPGKYDFYEISQALVHILLARPKLHSILTLEMLLKTDLYELRARGYNVERILQKKQQEARMAEDLRQKELEEERRLVHEREAERLKLQAQRQLEESDSQQQHHTMPGVFPDSPSHQRLGEKEHTGINDQDFNPGGFFSNLSKRFGLDDNKRAQNPFQSLFQNRSLQEGGIPGSSSEVSLPPPYSETDPRAPNRGSSANPNEPRSVTSPNQLHNNLLSAISACRPHGASGVYSRPDTNQVTETKSYCDERPSHDLEYVATLPSRLHFLSAKSVAGKSAFLSENSAGINAFAKILVECASIFSVRLESISIFYDPAGKTIAFNRAGSLFCNYLFFKQLHQTRLSQDPIGGRADALVYWWVILCHELAHNLVEDHSSDHSFYTEGFVTQYFSKVAEKLLTDSP